MPGYEAVQWFGVLAPKGTPREIITKVHGAVVRALNDPDIKKHLIKDGADPAGSTPEEFYAYIRSETEKWGKVVRDTGIVGQWAHIAEFNPIEKAIQCQKKFAREGIMEEIHATACASHCGGSCLMRVPMSKMD